MSHILIVEEHMTTTQILAHLIGDYWLQSGWMANNKTKNIWVAFMHALTYSLPIVFLCHPSLYAWLVIVTTHALIDRWRLSRYISFAKDFLAPERMWPKWKESKDTGYPNSLPPFLGFWLMIITDNVLHIAINAWALSNL